MLDTKIRTSVLHAIKSRSWSSDQGSYAVSGAEIEYEDFDVVIDSVAANPSGDHESEFRCKICGAGVPIVIHQQEMLHYPKEKLGEHNEIRDSLIRRVNNKIRLFHWGLPALLLLWPLLFIVLWYYFPSTLSEYVDSGGGGDRAMYLFLGVIGTGAIYYFLSPWVAARHLGRRAIRRIRSGDTGLLIDRSYAQRLVLPMPDWVETRKVIREVLIQSIDHKFLGGSFDTENGGQAGILQIIRPSHVFDEQVEEVAKDRFKEWTGNRTNVKED